MRVGPWSVASCPLLASGAKSDIRDIVVLRWPLARSQFESLDVYQLSERLADAIWDVVADWESFAKSTVGRQIVRSADSIGANIAEGSGRGSFQDNRRFVRMGRGSLNETQHWLRRAFRRGLLSEKDVATIKPLVDELAPRLMPT